MQGLSSLRLGRGLRFRAKRARIRRKQPRYAGQTIRSAFKQKPVVPRPKQPYLSTSIKLEDLL
jgi:hypothetical protein